ncbi:helix-turn-helix transcriptional regulator [Parvularcula sp. IMCC14364]|uniref:ArsR/SmtB family transcription factor n=1 Tax=Parvularcula sp. IMCC14364 TaxID=3067902 RepID=UPI002740C9B7|nr:metalloregulator ArsR/SmtB family transcription factor [Parvularcula sp. IMCC14364]
MKMDEAASMFTALGQGTRLSVFRLLVEHGNSGLQAGEISRLLQVNDSTLSRHLARLEQAGLVTSRRETRHIHYAVVWNGMDDLIRFIVSDCCRRDPTSCLKESCCD